MSRIYNPSGEYSSSNSTNQPFQQWKRVFDAKQGKWYFYNAETGSASWTHPSNDPNIRRMIDQKSGRPFWFNSVTKQSSWRNPEEIGGSTNTTNSGSATDSMNPIGSDQYGTDSFQMRNSNRMNMQTGIRMTGSRYQPIQQNQQKIEPGFNISPTRGSTELSSSKPNLNLEIPSSPEKTDATLSPTSRAQLSQEAESGFREIEQLNSNLLTRLKAKISSGFRTGSGGTKNDKESGNNNEYNSHHAMMMSNLETQSMDSMASRTTAVRNTWKRVQMSLNNIVNGDDDNDGNNNETDDLSSGFPKTPKPTKPQIVSPPPVNLLNPLLSDAVTPLTQGIEFPVKKGQVSMETNSSLFGKKRSKWKHIWLYTQKQLFLGYKYPHSPELIFCVDLSRVAGIEMVNKDEHNLSCEFALFNSGLQNGVLHLKCDNPSEAREWVGILQEIKKLATLQSISATAASINEPTSKNTESGTSNSSSKALPPMDPSMKYRRQQSSVRNQGTSSLRTSRTFTYDDDTIAGNTKTVDNQSVMTSNKRGKSESDAPSSPSRMSNNPRAARLRRVMRVQQQRRMSLPRSESGDAQSSVFNDRALFAQDAETVNSIGPDTPRLTSFQARSVDSALNESSPFQNIHKSFNDGDSTTSLSQTTFGVQSHQQLSQQQQQLPLQQTNNNTEVLLTNLTSKIEEILQQQRQPQQSVQNSPLPSAQHPSIPANSNTPSHNVDSQFPPSSVATASSSVVDQIVLQQQQLQAAFLQQQEQVQKMSLQANGAMNNSNNNNNNSNSNNSNNNSDPHKIDVHVHLHQPSQLQQSQPQQPQIQAKQTEEKEHENKDSQISHTTSQSPFGNSQEKKVDSNPQFMSPLPLNEQHQQQNQELPTTPAFPGNFPSNVGILSPFKGHQTLTPQKGIILEDMEDIQPSPTTPLMNDYGNFPNTQKTPSTSNYNEQSETPLHTTPQPYSPSKVPIQTSRKPVSESIAEAAAERLMKQLSLDTKKRVAEITKSTTTGDDQETWKPYTPIQEQENENENDEDRDNNDKEIEAKNTMRATMNMGENTDDNNGMKELNSSNIDDDEINEQYSDDGLNEEDEDINDEFVEKNNNNDNVILGQHKLETLFEEDSVASTQPSSDNHISNARKMEEMLRKNNKTLETQLETLRRRTKLQAMSLQGLSSRKNSYNNSSNNGNNNGSNRKFDRHMTIDSLAGSVMNDDEYLNLNTTTDFAPLDSLAIPDDDHNNHNDGNNNGNNNDDDNNINIHEFITPPDSITPTSFNHDLDQHDYDHKFDIEELTSEQNHQRRFSTEEQIQEEEQNDDDYDDQVQVPNYADRQMRQEDIEGSEEFSHLNENFGSPRSESGPRSLTPSSFDVGTITPPFPNNDNNPGSWEQGSSHQRQFGNGSPQIIEGEEYIETPTSTNAQQGYVNLSEEINIPKPQPPPASTKPLHWTMEFIKLGIPLDNTPDSEECLLPTSDFQSKTEVITAGCKLIHNSLARWLNDGQRQQSPLHEETKRLAAAFLSKARNCPDVVATAGMALEPNDQVSFALVIVRRLFSSLCCGDEGLRDLFDASVEVMHRNRLQLQVTPFVEAICKGIARHSNARRFFLEVFGFLNESGNVDKGIDVRNFFESNSVDKSIPSLSEWKLAFNDKPRLLQLCLERVASSLDQLPKSVIAVTQRMATEFGEPQAMRFFFEDFLLPGLAFVLPDMIDGVKICVRGFDVLTTGAAMQRFRLDDAFLDLNRNSTPNQPFLAAVQTCRSLLWSNVQSDVRRWTIKQRLQLAECRSDLTAMFKRVLQFKAIKEELPPFLPGILLTQGETIALAVSLKNAVGKLELSAQVQTVTSSPSSIQHQLSDVGPPLDEFCRSTLGLNAMKAGSASSYEAFDLTESVDLFAAQEITSAAIRQEFSSQLTYCRQLIKEVCKSSSSSATSVSSFSSQIIRNLQNRLCESASERAQSESMVDFDNFQHSVEENIDPVKQYEFVFTNLSNSEQLRYFHDILEDGFSDLKPFLDADRRLKEQMDSLKELWEGIQERENQLSAIEGVAQNVITDTDRDSWNSLQQSVAGDGSQMDSNYRVILESPKNPLSKLMRSVFTIPTSKF